MKTRSNYLLLSIFSALLLSIAWYLGLSIVIFFALVPLLILEDRLSTQENISRRKLKLWGYAYLTFLGWNLMVTWWVVFASTGGAILAFTCNSLLMSIVLLIFSNIKNRIGKPGAVWLLIPLWLAWEHGHTLWDISWTWLTLGNVLAVKTGWIQWFEFTGVSGGSAWILAVNILIFKTLKNNATLKLLSKPVLKIAAAIILPILASYLLLLVRKSQANAGDKTRYANVVVVQPNIDPYNTKFSLDFQTQFLNFIKLVKGKIKPNTDYLVLPETFITEDFNEAFINQSPEIGWFRDSLLQAFPNLKIVTGGNTYMVYRNQKDITATARKDDHSGEYFDYFNSGFLIDRQHVQVYHKSKLVPGAERMPFPAVFKFLEAFAIDMGGTTGSLGTQPQRSVFADSAGFVTVAPVICYESIYGDYLTEYIRKKANLIFIITNDGWWDNTPGYIQHLNYARLRAIENRRQIARSANTGISCFINEFGEISQPTQWWTEAVIEEKMLPNNALTFFSRFGDLLSYCAMITSVALILFSLYLWLSTRRRKV